MERFSVQTIDTKTARQGLMPTLNNLRPGDAVMLRSDPSPIPDEEMNAVFREQPMHSIGREHSMHDVTFGDLSIRKADTQLSCPAVAIKPYPRQWPWLAEHDFVVSHMLDAASGRKITYTTIGFLRNSAGEIAGITEFEQGVQSCDNLLYGNRQERSDVGGVELALETALKTLFILHNEGLIHGDFFPRNTAIDHELRPRIIDLTTIDKAKNPDDFVRDIRDYSVSVLSPNWGDALKKDVVIDNLLQPYADAASDILPQSARISTKRAIGKIITRLLSNN